MKTSSNPTVQRILKSGNLREWHAPEIIEYISTGHSTGIENLPSVLPNYYHGFFWRGILPDPPDWDDESTRIIHIAIAQNIPLVVQAWLQTFCYYTDAKWEYLNSALETLRRCGVSESWLISSLAEARLTVEGTSQPTLAGELLNRYSDEELDIIPRKYRKSSAVLFAALNPNRLRRFLEIGWWEDLAILDWAGIVEANPEFHKSARGYYVRTDYDRSKIAKALARKKPDLYRSWAINELIEISKCGPDYYRRDGILQLLYLEAQEAIPAALKWIQDYTVSSLREDEGYAFQRAMLLRFVKEHAWDESNILAKAAAQCKTPAVRQAGLQAWFEAGVGSVKSENSDFMLALRDALNGAEGKYVICAVKLTIAFDLSAMAPEIWPLMQHKSRPVRTAAARALAALGFAEASPNGIKLLQSKKADVRLSAVTLFQRLGGAESMPVLKERLETEEADAVRDAILLTLDAAGSLSLSAADFAAGVQRTLAKAKGCPVAWLDPAKLNLARQDGSNLSADEVLYLLIRQSRCNEMRADIEARPLYAALDRKSCAASALDVLEAFLASTQESGDRWTIAFAALTGDDRLVPPLHRAVIHWTENARGKLAEYAVGALALIGTDAALMLLDSLSVRFRSKNKNIGEAAAEAFLAAAESRGVTVEELGDMVVPWLGFESGDRKFITAGANSWEVWIGPDFKLVYKDTKTGKKLGKLPASVGSAIAEEQKLLSANLKEAVKAQLLRMETLLVRQFHWPVARWRELYLRHPLLRPFSEQLIWRYHPTDHKPPLTFRSLDDGGLTNAAGDAVELPNEGTVSLLHPLDIAEAEKEAWLTHMEDYEMLPPFPQLLRPVHICRTEDQPNKVVSTVSGTELNAMTFRGRSEKLGWVRSSVCDGGGVGAYRKVFSGTGVDAFLQLEGMYVGITMHDSITLGDVYFVTSGSVKVGSYTYDEPSDGNDPRVVTLGQVPPVAYSEVMADLYKISGKTEGAEAQPA